MDQNTLYIDIETAPHEGLFYGSKWETSILMFTEYSYLTSYSGRWGNSDKIFSKSLIDYPLFNKNHRDDTELVKDLHALFQKAHRIVAHNGKAFDVKKARALFIKHKLPALPKFEVIDTKTEAKKLGLFPSNSLEDIAMYFGIGKKIDRGGKDMIERLRNGDRKAFVEDSKYCKHDVWLLYEVHMRLRPWIENHPHVRPDLGRDFSCSACGSTEFAKRGMRILVKGIVQDFQCKGCGHYKRLPVTKTDAENTNGSTAKERKGAVRKR